MKQLRFPLAFLLVWMISGAVFSCTSVTGGGELVVADSLLTVVRVGKLAGYGLYRVDDHERRVTCYGIALGGMDCDRSFYERR